MPIRLSGLVSNMDTDALVKELVSAYSIKKDRFVKAQTKLEWKQDAWKSLNSKIDALRKSMGNLKFTTAYKKKATSISDTTKATVSAANSAVNGTQSLIVEKLAKPGYLTGGKLAAGTTAATKMSELGFTGAEGSFEVAVGSKRTSIYFTAASTVKDVVAQLNDAGVNASFDSVNNRIFVNSKDSGEAQNFSLTANNAGGLEALKNLGLYVASSASTEAYKKYAQYDGISYNPGFNVVTEKDNSQRLQSELDALTPGTPQYEAKAAEKEQLDKTIGYHELVNKEIADQKDVLNKANQALIEQNEELQRTNQKYQEKLDEKEAAISGESYYSEVCTGGNLDLQKIKDKIQDLNTKLEDDTLTSADREEFVKQAKALSEIGTIMNYQNANNSKIANNNIVIAKNIEVRDDTAANGVGVTSSVSADYAARVSSAVAALADTGYSTGATKIDGSDAKIVLNGAEFTSSSNTFTINGLTITAQEISDKDVDGNFKTTSIVTSDDVGAIYDVMKNFIKQYNSLISEMDKLYNSTSSKGYEPLTDEEKDAMSDQEVEKWEKKIKDSLLRRDDTLDSVSNMMKTGMMKSYEINGETYSLASFGIKTLGYFSSGENEKSMYHIDGDPDDENTSGKTDKLKNMIASDPEAVNTFFSKLTSDMYDDLTKKMSSTELRSIYHVYNDKQMKTDYDNYTKTIKKWEQKITDMEEKYYRQFTAMETALAKMQSSSSALAGMLGGG